MNLKRVMATMTAAGVCAIGLGLSMPAAPADAGHKVMSTSKWRKNLKAEGFEKMPKGVIKKHGECWYIAPDGDTAVVVCRDGYVTTS